VTARPCRREVGHGPALEAFEIGGDLRERLGQHVLADGSGKAVALGEARGADVDAELLVDAVSVTEGEL
jgi:hypothetical protein